MLRRCEGPAETQCSVCGKQLCSEHTFALSPDQMTMLSIQPTTTRAVVCLACFRKTQPQQARQATQASQAADQRRRPMFADDNDPYYRYPYYGSYHPYLWGSDFSDRDRRVFDRQEARTGDHGTDSTFDS